MRFLSVPKNCPLKIKIGEGFFAEDDIFLPNQNEEDAKKDQWLPYSINVRLPGETTYTQFYRVGRGSFNSAYSNVNYTDRTNGNFPVKPIVLKIPVSDSELNSAERAERLFNIANQEALNARKSDQKFFGPARKFGNGCLFPFIISKQSTTNEICDRIIQLRNETGRIMWDGFIDENCLTEVKSGNVWIVDTDLVLDLGFKNDYPIKNVENANSEASFHEYYRDYLREKHFLSLLYPIKSKKFKFRDQEPLDKNERKIALLIMALIYLQENYPGVTDVTALKDNETLTHFFAVAYIIKIYNKHFSEKKLPELFPPPNSVCSASLQSFRPDRYDQDRVNQIIHAITQPQTPKLKSNYSGALISFSMDIKSGSQENRARQKAILILDKARKLHQQGIPKIGIIYPTSEENSKKLLDRQDNLPIGIAPEIEVLLRKEYADLQGIFYVVPLPVIQYTHRRDIACHNESIENCLAYAEKFVADGGVILNCKNQVHTTHTEQHDWQKVTIDNFLQDFEKRTSFDVLQKCLLEKKKITLQELMDFLRSAKIFGKKVDVDFFKQITLIDFQFAEMDFSLIFDDTKNDTFLKKFSTNGGMLYQTLHLTPEYKIKLKFDLLLSIANNPLKQEWIKRQFQIKHTPPLVIMLKKSSTSEEVIQHWLQVINNLKKMYIDRQKRKKHYSGYFGWFGSYDTNQKLNAIAFFDREFMNAKGSLDITVLSRNKALMDGRLGYAVKAILTAQRKINSISVKDYETPMQKNFR